MEYCPQHKRFCRHLPTNGMFLINDSDVKSVNLISGFLGAGKTTMVRTILENNPFKNIHVIVREYGEIAIDDKLLNTEEERIHIFTGASMHVDPQTMLYNYMESMYDRSLRHPFDHLLIETSGAESAENMLKMFFLPGFRDHYSLSSFVTVVDAEYGALNLEQFRTAREQIAFADVIVINKMDRAAASATDELTSRIRTINPYAKIVYTTFGAVDLQEIQECGIFDQLGSMNPQVLKTQGSNIAMDEFCSVSLCVDEPLDLEAVNRWITDTFEKYGLSILRGKGFFNIAGSDYRHEFQSVRKTFHSKTDTLWDNDKRKSVIVFIGTKLPPRSELQAALERCRA